MTVSIKLRRPTKGTAIVIVINGVLVNVLCVCYALLSSARALADFSGDMFVYVRFRDEIKSGSFQSLLVSTSNLQIRATSILGSGTECFGRMTRTAATTTLK